MRTIFTAIILGSCAANAAADASRRTIEVELGGQRVQGTPLFSSDARIDLLGRDGRLWSFAPQTAKDLKQIGSSFQSYPASVLKGRLQAELGKSFRIVSTGHYLVALPQNVRTNWAERFEDLYRSFALYFSVRGFQLREPEFPLVAIVWPDRESFLRRRTQKGTPRPRICWACTRQSPTASCSSTLAADGAMPMIGGRTRPRSSTRPRTRPHSTPASTNASPTIHAGSSKGWA